MRIRLLLFGQLKEVTGQGEQMLELPAEATVSQLLEHYAVQAPAIRKYLSNLAVAVNQEYATREARLREADEVALIPPVSGGAPHEADDSR